MKKVTVLTVDDHPLALAGIEKILAQAEDIVLIGKAASGDEAIQMMATVRPQILLLDLKMPGIPAREVEEWVRKNYPETITLVLTSHDRDYYLTEMANAGIAGYLDKNARGEQLIAAIRRAARGENLFTQEQITRIEKWQAEAGVKWKNLTKREREVLKLLVTGENNGQIAEKLTLTERTVVFHVSNILRKLGVENRQEAVAWVIKHIPDFTDN